MTETPIDQEFDWITLPKVQKLLGDPSKSSVYDDPELRALAVNFTEPGRRVGRVRWRQHEIRFHHHS